MALVTKGRLHIHMQHGKRSTQREMEKLIREKWAIALKPGSPSMESDTPRLEYTIRFDPIWPQRKLGIAYACVMQDEVTRAHTLPDNGSESLKLARRVLYTMEEACAHVQSERVTAYRGKPDEHHV